MSLGYNLPPQVLGAACHSGVKCARLNSGGALLGLAVASRDNALEVSVWAAPEDGSCEGLEVSLVAESGGESSVAIAAAEATADEDGWCHYQALAPERIGAQYLYLENNGSEAIVDDASIVPAAPAMKQVQALPARLDQQKLERVVAWGRAAKHPRLPPPNEAMRRFRSHMRKRWGRK